MKFSGNNLTACCKHCKKVYVAEKSSSSNLRKHLGVAQMIEGVRGKVGDRYDRNEATVRELVSAIGSALHRIDELDQKRLQFRQALASVLSLLGDD
ncbi:hypothetical protein HPB47_020489 [Ixodes persulcatus]|uniref:Uncharacterized protein n=1 Tax=Ixodes persulcatus TaxID=34615 RepID=A0AC60QG80_IXOPE|nr:hypothetical protein HPB47_020489 [Ixodes persulcatus]